MSILFDRITLLCQERATTLYAIETGAGLNKGTIRRWADTLPSWEKVLQVAQYIDVSVDYLLGNTENPLSHKNNPQDLAAAAAKIAETAGVLNTAATTTAVKLQNDLKEILDTYHISACALESEPALEGTKATKKKSSSNTEDDS